MPRIKSRSSVNGTAETHEFLPDARVEAIFERLHSEIEGLPDDTQYATTVQPGRWVDKNGIAVLQPESVVFWAICKNPQSRWKDKFLKQYAVMSIDDWRKAEEQKWRFAGAPDPAYIIFRSLSLKLKDTHKSWSELN